MITGHAELTLFLDKLKAEGKKVAVYAGFDPTGNSLHLGHLGVLSMLNRFKEDGHAAIALIGTGTAFIGDPTGKNEMRKMLDSETIDSNAIGIEEDIRKVIPGVEFIRNNWLRDLNFQHFMREAGSRIPLNDLLNLSIVKTRLESGAGITLMEAIYPVLQGWDMVVLARRAKELGCDTMLQIGGVDQTGNISMGIHLVNRLVDGVEADGILSPLIVTSSGEKMGKSAGNALFLNPDLTDDLLFFDSILSVPDDLVSSMIDVVFPELDKTSDIMILKRALAIGITGWVRGDDAVKNILDIKSKGFDAGNIRTVEFNSEGGSISIVRILKETGLTDSLSDARRMIKNKGIKINGENVINDDEMVSGPSNFILSKGKKNHVKIIIV